MGSGLTTDGRASDRFDADGLAALEIDPDRAAWDSFVADSPRGSYLQTSAWAQVKAANGWSALRFTGRAPGTGDPGANSPR